MKNPALNQLIGISSAVVAPVEAFQPFPAMSKGPKFTLSGDTITFTKDGSTGRVTKSGESITVLQLQYNGKPGKADGLYKRMTDWYYFNHVRK